MYGQCGLRIFDVLLFLFVEYKGSSGCLVPGGQVVVRGRWLVGRRRREDREWVLEVGMGGLCSGGVEVEGRGRRQLFLKSNAHASGITDAVSGGKAIRWNLGDDGMEEWGGGGGKEFKIHDQPLL